MKTKDYINSFNGKLVWDYITTLISTNTICDYLLNVVDKMII